MKHIEAQKLRGELETINTTLRFLEGKRSQRAKAEQDALEERKEALLVALKDAPPVPWSPQEIWDKIERWAKGKIAEADSYHADFMEYYTDQGAASAIASYGQSLVVAEVLSARAKQILELGEGEADLVKRAETLFEGLSKLANNLQERIIEDTQNPMNSTNAASNLVRLWETQGLAKLHQELTSSRWGRLPVDWLARSFQAWKELQEELAAQGGE